MDNRIFNVNGSGDAMLLDTLKLVFAQKGDKTTCVAWKITKEQGLILLWYKANVDGVHAFPASLTAQECLPYVLVWLKSDDAKMTQQTGWDADRDHEGHNGEGWRVYCEDWGNVDHISSVICAVKPVMLWFGK